MWSVNATIQSHEVTAGGLRLHYLEAGQGPAVLLLHGWPTCAQLWRHVLPRVGRTRRAIALDLPGFGRSQKPLDRPYSFGLFERTLDAFLDALEIDDVGLVVHDLGGPVGLYWAVNHAERVRELAILNTLCFPELSWAVKAFVLATHVPGIRGYISSPSGVARAMRFGVVDTSKITPQVAKMYGEPFEDRAARKALLKAGQGLSPRRFAQVGEGLSRFSKIPVRLLYGERDRILPDVAETMDRIQAILPHAQRSSIPDCGHFLQEDRPDDVAEALAEFFGDPPR
jgi:pimeloyl-ACP methyl ester carboxylesterase